MARPSMTFSALKTMYWGGLVLILGCGGNTTPAPEATASVSANEATGDVVCDPTFVSLNEKPLEVWSGSWRFGFDVFLVGCQDELSQLTAEEREQVTELVQERVREGGLSFFASQYGRDDRKELVADLNVALDGSVLGDILTVLRYSIEHEDL